MLERLLHEVSLVDNSLAFEALVAGVSDGRLGMASRIMLLTQSSFAGSVNDILRLIPERFGKFAMLRLHLVAPDG